MDAAMLEKVRQGFMKEFGEFSNASVAIVCAAIERTNAGRYIYMAYFQPYEEFSVGTTSKHINKFSELGYLERVESPGLVKGYIATKRLIDFMAQFDRINNKPNQK